MSEFIPDNDDFEEMVRGSFAKQGFMAHLGAEIAVVRPGYCEIQLERNSGLLQQHGFFYAGALSSIIDTAGGYAAFSLFDAGDGGLTVEFKINCMAPGDGDRVIAWAEVVRPGRTLTVTKGEVVAFKDGKETVCVLMQQTIMRITGRADVKG
jgi:uncharacterized protein (TIGR00369 family)